MTDCDGPVGGELDTEDSIYRHLVSLSPTLQHDRVELVGCVTSPPDEHYGRVMRSLRKAAVCARGLANVRVSGVRVVCTATGEQVHEIVDAGGNPSRAGRVLVCSERLSTRNFVREFWAQPQVSECAFVSR